MKSRSKLYVFAMISAGIALSGSLQRNYTDSVTYKLMVTGGTGTGDYAPGTMVIVSGSAAPAGASFVSWTGDVEILANRFLSKTTATVPLQGRCYHCLRSHSDSCYREGAAAARSLGIDRRDAHSREGD
jgi:hypothetical protein